HLPGHDRLRPGERAEVGGIRVLALPAGDRDGRPDPGRSVLVLGSAGRTLLWAPGTGPLPDVTLDALRDAGLDAAVLDARTAATGSGAPGSTDPGSADPGSAGTISDATASGSTASGATAPGDAGGGLGLAHQLARLRQVNAFAADARVVAAGLPHEGPPAARYAELSRPWGVEVLPDGAPLWPAGDPHAQASAAGSSWGPAARDGSRRPWRTVVLGAAASGKSLVAESLLAAEPEVVYAATGPQPDGSDPAWADRVAAHRRRRPDWWRTVEGADLAQLLTRPGAPLLVDSLGTWLAAELSAAGAWDDRDGWRDRLTPRLDGLVAAWRQAARPVVAVVEEVGWGVVPATASGGRFRDLLGTLSRRLAEQSEAALLVVAGRPLDLERLGGSDPAGGPSVQEPRFHHEPGRSEPGPDEPGPDEQGPDEQGPDEQGPDGPGRARPRREEWS
ncbi:MAG TPA: bifunctional adenosylcobinamide kinase/adenosylcobinamide-phosphate guanylyltransferase, partial [Kineosporiaceae bacterium]|nr:bifunctional adenosylcobinamide kinase/adenosylcobinamide-phosphate guanylyltransferase [Kineosporiaceae bacterium]